MGCLSLGGANQLPQGFLRSALELATYQQPHQPAPPPGREMKVSIEPDQRPAPIALCQRDALVVINPKRQMGDEVDPAEPAKAQRRCAEADHLSRPRRPGR